MKSNIKSDVIDQSQQQSQQQQRKSVKKHREAEPDPFASQEEEEEEVPLKQPERPKLYVPDSDNETEPTQPIKKPTLLTNKKKVKKIQDFF